MLFKESVLFVVVLAFVALVIFTGCVTVKPYERENLADSIMSFEAHAEEDAMEMHFLLTREGSMGGYGGAGGGCACN